jgi:hypothetical protein
MAHGLYLPASQNLTARAEHMFAGVLKIGSLPTMCCLINREAPVRACFTGTPRTYNFEIKCVDGTANPYLALCSILAAGLLGVKGSSLLNMKACQGA